MFYCPTQNKSTDVGSKTEDSIKEFEDEEPNVSFGEGSNDSRNTKSNHTYYQGSSSTVLVGNPSRKGHSNKLADVVDGADHRELPNIFFAVEVWKLF